VCVDVVAVAAAVMVEVVAYGGHQQHQLLEGGQQLVGTTQLQDLVL
jgi:hypothetical protein